MLKLKSFIVALTIAGVSLGGVPAQAADPLAAGSEVVEYRLEAWKTTHAEGAKADQFVGTLKKLRCEVKVGTHGTSYRRGSGISDGVSGDAGLSLDILSLAPILAIRERVMP